MFIGATTNTVMNTAMSSGSATVTSTEEVKLPPEPTGLEDVPDAPPSKPVSQKVDIQAKSNITARVQNVQSMDRPTLIRYLTGVCRADLYAIQSATTTPVRGDGINAGRVIALLCAGLERPYVPSIDAPSIMKTGKSISFAGLLRYIQLLGVGTGHDESAIERLIFSTRMNSYDPSRDEKEAEYVSNIGNGLGDRADGVHKNVPMNIRTSIRRFLEVQRKECERVHKTHNKNPHPASTCHLRGSNDSKSTGNPSPAPTFCSFGDALSQQRKYEKINGCQNRAKGVTVSQYDRSIHFGAHRDPFLEIIRSSNEAARQITNPKELCRYYLGFRLMSGSSILYKHPEEKNRKDSGVWLDSTDTRKYTPYCTPLNDTIGMYQRKKVLPIIENVRYYETDLYRAAKPRVSDSINRNVPHAQPDANADITDEISSDSTDAMIRTLLEAPPLRRPQFDPYHFSGSRSGSSRANNTQSSTRCPFSDVFKQLDDILKTDKQCREEGLRNQVAQRGTAIVLHHLHRQEHFSIVHTLRRELDKVIQFRGAPFCSRMIDCLIDAFSKPLSREDIWLFPDGVYVMAKMFQGPVVNTTGESVAEYMNMVKDRRSVVFVSERLARNLGLAMRLLFSKEGDPIALDPRWKRVRFESGVHIGKHSTESMLLRVSINDSAPHMNMGWFNIGPDGLIDRDWPLKADPTIDAPLRIGFGEAALLFINPDYVRNNRWMGPGILTTAELQSLEAFIEKEYSSEKSSPLQFWKEWVVSGKSEAEKMKQEEMDRKAAMEIQASALKRDQEKTAELNASQRAVVKMLTSNP